MLQDAWLNAESARTTSLAQVAAAQPEASELAAPLLPPLLAVDVRRLRPDLELERIFGKRVVGAEDRDEGQGAHLCCPTPGSDS